MVTLRNQSRLGTCPLLPLSHFASVSSANPGVSITGHLVAKNKTCICFRAYGRQAGASKKSDFRKPDSQRPGNLSGSYSLWGPMSLVFSRHLSPSPLWMALCHSLHFNSQKDCDILLTLGHIQACYPSSLGNILNYVFYVCVQKNFYKIKIWTYPTSD